MNTDPEICFECGGRYLEKFEDYLVELPEGETLVVPELRLLRCEHCGEAIIPPESDRRIEAAIEEYSDSFGPEEVKAFLAQFQADQTEAARALGMGAKTFHRWAKGTQRVSRSMGYFLRALMAHPELFEWIRERQWKTSAPSPTDAGFVRAGEALGRHPILHGLGRNAD